MKSVYDLMHIQECKVKNNQIAHPIINAGGFMWKVERDKVVACRQVVAPYTVGVYRWRWVAVTIAWMMAHGWWGCYVSKVDK